MNSKYLFLFVFISVFFFACDIITTEGVFYAEKAEAPDTTQNPDVIERSVLLIEFTGHKCPNCPKAHKTVKELSAIYKEQLIPISIHAGILAYPQGTYTYNFLTAEGTDMYKSFGISGIPIGVVNSLDKNNLKSNEGWATDIENLIEITPNIDIQMTHSEKENVITTTVKYKTTEDITNKLKICVYLIEDKIVSKQDSSGIEIEDYLHRHVFRDSYTATIWGEDLKNTELIKDTEYIETFTLNFNNVWNRQNCYVITYIYDDLTKEVLNAKETKLIEEK